MDDVTTRPLRTSSSIAALAGALAKAQAAFLPVRKDRTAEIQTKTGGHFSYAYVDLATIQEAIRGPLAANELAITQALRVHDHRVTVETVLLHASGEWLASELALAILDTSDPRSVGSAVTYGRRFGLSALVGIAAGDDDDAAAVTPTTPPARRRATPAPPPDVELPPRRVHPESRPITEPQMKKLWAITGTRKSGNPWPNAAAVKQVLYVAFGIDSVSDLRMADFDQACAIVARGPQPAAPKVP